MSDLADEFAAHVARAHDAIALGTYPTLTVEQLLAYYAGADRFAFAWRDGHIVGHAEVRIGTLTPHRAFVSAAVERAYWGRGLGRSLLSEVLGWCDDNGIAWVDGWRWADNEAARRMDHALGFVDVQYVEDAWRAPDGSSRDQVVMTRRRPA